jgi:hypothetical protein
VNPLTAAQAVIYSPPLSRPLQSTTRANAADTYKRPIKVAGYDQYQTTDLPPSYTKQSMESRCRRCKKPIESRYKVNFCLNALGRRQTCRYPHRKEPNPSIKDTMAAIHVSGNAKFPFSLPSRVGGCRIGVVPSGGSCRFALRRVDRPRAQKYITMVDQQLNVIS